MEEVVSAHAPHRPIFWGRQKYSKRVWARSLSNNLETILTGFPTPIVRRKYWNWNRKYRQSKAPEGPVIKMQLFFLLYYYYYLLLKVWIPEYNHGLAAPLPPSSSLLSQSDPSSAQGWQSYCLYTGKMQRTVSWKCLGTGILMGTEFNMVTSMQGRVFLWQFSHLKNGMAIFYLE